MDQPPDVSGKLTNDERVAERNLEVAGHEFRLFAEVKDYIDDLVVDIRTAQRRVWIESYIFADDEAGRAVVAALTERAQAGVEVRVMYDAIGSLSTPSRLFAPLVAAGGQVHVFHSLWEALRRWAFFERFNRRNHRKLTVIDDRVAYFGGMNIVDQRHLIVADKASKLALPISAGWRDAQTRMVGPKVIEIAAAMEWLWRKVHDEKVRRRPKWRLKEALAQVDADAFELFDADPRHPRRRVGRIFAEVIGKAQVSLIMSVAYFLPSTRLLKALERARRRGVTVTLILPGVSDVKAVQYATRYLYARLLKNKIIVYERQDRMLHSKVVTGDQRWTILGSSNMDSLSLHHNLEFVGVFQSQPMAAGITAICQEEIEHSELVTSERYDRRRWWERVRDRICWSLRNWL